MSLGLLAVIVLQLFTKISLVKEGSFRLI